MAPDTDPDQDDNSAHEHGRMGARGVSRPMAGQEALNRQQESDRAEKGSKAHNGSHSGEMGSEDRFSMLRTHHEQTLWGRSCGSGDS